MAIDVKTLAFVNFYAAMGTLEKYVEYDENARELAKRQNINVRFKVLGDGPDGVLIFDDGKVTVLPYDKSIKTDIVLICKDPEHFNKVVEGKAMPIPVKGLFKTLSFMGNAKSPFMVLTDNMAKLMRQKEFTDPAERELSTKLAFYAMVAGIATVGNHDPIARYAMRRIKNGEIILGIRDVCYATLVKTGGNGEEAKLACVRQKLNDGKAFMTFDSVDTAKGLIDGDLDAMACISSGKLDTRGHMLMLDNVNKILNIVPKYLA